MAMIKVKSTHPESQGPFVLMDEADFDAKKHKLYVELAEAMPEQKPEPAPSLHTASRKG
jgi:hypothetical protein